MGIKDRIAEELARQEAERQAAEEHARQVAEKRAAEVATAETRRQLELAKERAKITEVIGRLDSIGVADLLEEVNRDIWKGRGHIEARESKDAPNGVVNGMRITLEADVPTSIEEIITKTRGKNYGSYEEYFDRSHQDVYPSEFKSFHGWHWVIKSVVSGHVVHTSNHGLTIGYIVGSGSRPEVRLLAFDAGFTLPTFAHEGVIFDEDSSSVVLPRSMRSSSGLGIELVMDRVLFDLSLARNFVDHAILTDSVLRTQNPIEGYFQRVEEDIARIRSRIGSTVGSYTDGRAGPPEEPRQGFLSRFRR